MTNEELSQTLNRLHEQLSQNPQLDEPTRQSLRKLLDEIEAAAIRNDRAAVMAEAPETETVTPAAGGLSAESAEDLSLSQRLRKAVEDFEFRHPQLTVTLSQIADSLSEMGI